MHACPGPPLDAVRQPPPEAADMKGYWTRRAILARRRGLGRLAVSEDEMERGRKGGNLSQATKVSTTGIRGGSWCPRRAGHSENGISLLCRLPLSLPHSLFPVFPF